MRQIPESGGTEAEQKAVCEQLDRILASGPFVQSRRRQRFLEYVVQETLAGRGDRLKGYDIALKVFDRPEDFDPNADPIVRIEAGRLRDKLREYYDGDGHDDPVRIELPKGAYTPTISFRQADIPTSAPEPAGPSEEAVADGEHLSTPVMAVDNRRKAAVAALALLLSTAGSGLWFLHPPTKPSAQSTTEAPAVVMPTVPAIAVLPFTNLSGDAKEDYFSDGLTEDILTELARSRDLRVLARNTTFQYKGQAVDVGKLGRDLNVRYVLEGSARRAGDRVRITAQLIDSETGSHVWADSYDRELADIFLVQDEVVTKIVAAIAGSYGAIERAEARSAARKNPNQLQAYDLILHARETMQWDWTPDTFRTARATLNQAMALDPSNARARRELAWLAVMGWVFQLDEKPVPPAEILAQATKAVELDPADARARMVAASAYFFTKQLDRFAGEADEALTRAPYDAEIIAAMACMISSAGDHERGVALARKANALNADAASGWYNSTVYTALYLAGDYKGALEIAQQNKDLEMFYAYLEIIPIYGQLGMKPQALEAWRNLRKDLPDATAATFENWWRLWNIRDPEVAKLMDGVYKSGVLEAALKSGQ